MRALQGFAAPNERTLPADIEQDPFHDPELLEEDFVDGVRLMRTMVAEAPDEIAADLGAHADAIASSRTTTPTAATTARRLGGRPRRGAIFEPHAIPEKSRTVIAEWFVANCGIDLQSRSGSERGGAIRVNASRLRA